MPYGRAYMEVWSSGALEVRCRRADEEVWSSGALETRRRRVDVWHRVMELGSSGGALRACRCGGMELASSGGMPRALGTRWCRSIEVWTCAAGLGAWRCQLEQHTNLKAIYSVLLKANTYLVKVDTKRPMTINTFLGELITSSLTSE